MRYADGNEAKPGDVVQVLENFTVDSTCRVFRGDKHVISEVSPNYVFVGHTSWNPCRFALVHRAEEFDKSDQSPPPAPVWVKGPPTKPGIYQIPRNAREGERHFTVVEISEPSRWTGIQNHVFMFDFPANPVHPAPKIPTPRGLNDHFGTICGEWQCVVCETSIAISNVKGPVMRKTIARLAMGYGWTGDGWGAWAGVEEGAAK